MRIRSWKNDSRDVGATIVVNDSLVTVCPCTVAIHKADISTSQPITTSWCSEEDFPRHSGTTTIIYATIYINAKEAMAWSRRLISPWWSLINRERAWNVDATMLSSSSASTTLYSNLAPETRWMSSKNTQPCHIWPIRSKMDAWCEEDFESYIDWNSTRSSSEKSHDWGRHS